MEFFKKPKYVCEFQNWMYLVRNKLFERNETFREKIDTTRAHIVHLGRYKRNYQNLFEISEVALCVQFPNSHLSSPEQSFPTPTIHLVKKL